MAFHIPTMESKMRGSPRSLQTSVLPAPIGGINGRENLASNDVSECVYCYNLVPTEYGLRTREGYREWATGLNVSTGAGVRTIIAFRDLTGRFTGDKLFAATNEGIWDISTSTTTPTRVATFTDTTGDSGYGNYIHYTTDAGAQIIYYADELNGLWKYDPASGGGTWSKMTTTEIPSGVDPANICFVTEHKRRIWFVERNTTNGWYLAVDAIQGATTKFSFGSKFSQGGDLVGLYNWTKDDGEGVDDLLIALGRGGDVVPFQGSDPSQDDWSSVGVFYVGDLPVGRRVASEYGGELRFLCGYGLLSISDVLSGVSRLGPTESSSQKIARFVREDLTLYGQQRNWEITFDPGEGILVINTPERTGEFIQYRLNFNVQAWGIWRGVPGVTFEVYQNHMMVGTKDNRVLRMDTTTDGGTLANQNADGTPVQFSMLHNYNDLQAPGLFKYGQFVRPNFLSQSPPTFTSTMLYDFNLAEVLNTTAPDSGMGASGIWNTSKWDQAVWATNVSRLSGGALGQWGRGRTVSVALTGEASTRATLVSTDVMWRPGGPF